jgi:von Willebrand factor type A domain/Aerotolerance regulator N-terminal
MSLANAPALLWLLLLFPIIIFFYLLKLKRREVVVSSVLLWAHLVKDVQANSPFQKLKRNLLLLLQLLTVLLLVCCLARPFMFVRALGGETSVVILDASGSMQSTDVGRSRFEEARKAALHMVDLMSRGDALMVILVGTRTRVLCPFTDSRAELRQAIGGARVEDGSANMLEAASLAGSMLQSRGKPGKSRIVILSDGAYSEMGDLHLTTGDFFQFVKFGRRSENVGIVAADVRQPLGGTGAWQAFVGVRNFGAQARSVNLELYENDNLIAIRELRIAAGAEKAEVFRDLTVGTGLLHIRLDLHDDLAVDNDAYTQLSPRQEMRVLLVSAGNLFLEKALNLERRVHVSRVTPAAYTGQSGFDVVVFDGVSPKVVGPGNLFYIHAAGPGAPVAVTGEVTAPTVVDVAAHPVTRYVTFGDVQINRALTVRAAAWARAVVEGPEGPLIVVGERAAGKALYVGFNMSIPDSSFCLKIGYPIFINNCLDWLAARPGQAEARQVRTGDVIPLDVPATVRALAIVGPDNRRYTIPVEGRRAYFNETSHVGLYRVDGAGFRRDIAVNLLNREESNIQPRDKLAFGHRIITGGSRGARSAREVWRWLGLAATLLLALEWYAYHRRL